MFFTSSSSTQNYKTTKLHSIAFMAIIKSTRSKIKPNLLVDCDTKTYEYCVCTTQVID